MIDFSVCHRNWRAFAWERRHGCLPRNAALCAVAALAALAILIAAAWHPPLAHADGGASARSQAAASAPDQSSTTIQAYTLRILRALPDDDANNWVRYWQARADCQAAAARHAHAASLLDQALIALTAVLCAQLDARLDVNPADYSPRGEDRTVGLLLNEPGAAAGYTLFTGFWNHDVFLLDPLGRVAHAWHLDISLYHAKLLDNGNLLATGWDVAFEFDPRGNIVWQYKVDGNLHHDFIKMPNGNILLLVRIRKTREEAIAAGANPEFVNENGIDHDYLMEVRPTRASGGEVVWEWSVWDHLIQDFDPTKPNYGAVAEHPELIDLNFLLKALKERPQHSPPRDWTHANAIDYNPELDQIMLSPRHFSELWIIDHSADTEEARGHSGGNGGMGGDLLYRWGNPRAYGQGDAGDQRLFWQHQTHWIPPGLPGAGNILLFNNGLEFVGDERFHSSADEFVPPADGYRYRRDEGEAYPPDELAWTYAAETRADFYAPLFSGAQRLPNGNTLIVDGTAGTIFQATADGKRVWEYVSPINRRSHLRQGEHASARGTFPTAHGDPVTWFANEMYRAYWHPPDYPGLRALDLTPGAYIEDSPDIYDRAYAAGAAALAGDFGERLADSDFDIYLDESEDEGRRSLIYIKQPCADNDTQASFFLHITPARPRDLPAHMEERGFDIKRFRFYERGKAHDGRCAALFGLPGYPIERIRTGQFVRGEGELWQAEINLNE